MTMLTATVDDLLRWEPCSRWTEDCIRFVAGKKERWSAADILNLKRGPVSSSVTHAELLWVVLRPQLIPQSVLRKIACRFIDMAAEVSWDDVEAVWDVFGQPWNAAMATWECMTDGDRSPSLANWA